MVQGMTIDRLSDSEMNVSWVPLTIVEARGFQGNYIVTYTSSVGRARRERQGSVVEAPHHQSNVVIGGLEAGVNYDVAVTTRNLNNPALTSRKANNYLPCSNSYSM